MYSRVHGLGVILAASTTFALNCRALRALKYLSTIWGERVSVLGPDVHLTGTFYSVQGRRNTPIPTKYRLTMSSHPNMQDPLNKSSAAGLRQPHTGHTAFLVDAKRPRLIKSEQTSFLACILAINLPRLGCFDNASSDLRTMTVGKTSCSCWPVEFDLLQSFWDLFLTQYNETSFVMFFSRVPLNACMMSRVGLPHQPSQGCLVLEDRYDLLMISR